MTDPQKNFRFSFSFIATLTLCALFAVSAAAETITGTVKNGTTGKPAAKENVALLELSQGMNEVAHTTTDANGSFSFNIENTSVPHMVSVTHDGASYFPQSGPLQPGMTTTEVTIYDSAKKVDGIKTKVQVLRVQAAQTNTLQVLELIAVDNSSNPPRAMIGDKTYEFFLPPGATLDQGMVQAPGGMPIAIGPKPEGKNKYALSYALKPGETRFEIAYHMPYSGDMTFSPKISEDIQHFVVMAPKSMSFEAKNQGEFSEMPDNTSLIQVATNLQAGADVSFRVSGTGTLPEDAGPPSAPLKASTGGGGGMPGADNRPGGGLGAPSEGPDPLQSYRWVILGGLAVIVIVGGVVVVTRSNSQTSTAPVPQPVSASAVAPVSAKAAAQAAPAGISYEAPQPAPVLRPVAPVVSAPQDHTSMLLQGLKEELFQLEIERQQGRISQEEYDKTKAALDQTLSRALARGRSNS